MRNHIAAWIFFNRQHNFGASDKIFIKTSNYAQYKELYKKAIHMLV